jgi:hypothetical protein
MTDLLNRPTVAPGTDEVVLPVADAPQPKRFDFDLSAASRIALAMLSGAAGLIHLVMVPGHMQESAIEGVLFALSGWIQIGLAVALATRPRRWLLTITIVVNLVFIGAWAISRIWGLPFGAHSGQPEAAAFADLTTVGFEAALVLLAGILLVRPSVGSKWSDSEFVFASIVPIAVIALTTGALMAPSTANHASAGHTHGANGEELVAADGHTHSTPTGEDNGFSALVNGQEHEGMAHTHGPDVALTADEQAQLDTELTWTQPLIDRYPTLADAKAGGYSEAGPFSPGLGLHLMPPIDKMAIGGDGVFDTEAELQSAYLIYDGIEDTSKLAGFMYMAVGTQGEPQGFAGANDHWHFHTNTCVVFADGKVQSPLGADRSATQEQCSKFGGTLIENTGYMVHLWNVPGYENPDGMFGNLTPAITCPDGKYNTVPDEEIGFTRTICRV